MQSSLQCNLCEDADLGAAGPLHQQMQIATRIKIMAFTHCSFFVLGKTVNERSTGMHIDTHRRDSIRQVFPASVIHCVEDTKSPGGCSFFFPNIFGRLAGG
jgi:hypothetical protein